MTCLEQHHLATNELMDNAFEEAPLPSHHRRSAVALAPEQRSLPSAGFYASYIYSPDLGCGEYAGIISGIMGLREHQRTSGITGGNYLGMDQNGCQL